MCCCRGLIPHKDACVRWSRTLVCVRSWRQDVCHSLSDLVLLVLRAGLHRRCLTASSALYDHCVCCFRISAAFCDVIGFGWKEWILFAGLRWTTDIVVFLDFYYEYFKVIVNIVIIQLNWKLFFCQLWKRVIFPYFFPHPLLHFPLFCNCTLSFRTNPTSSFLTPFFPSHHQF